MPGTHKCAIPGCKVRVEKTILMCHPHWGMLARDFRAALWNRYRNRSKNLVALGEYQAMVRQAIRNVQDVQSTTKETV